MTKTTTPKTTTTRRSPAKPTTAATAKTEPTVVAAVKPVAPTAAPVEAKVSKPELRKIELIDKVVELSGIKKRYAKPTIEAVLAVLGEALLEGRDLNLQPLGKVMAKNSKDAGSGNVINARIRQSKRNHTSEKETLADPVE